jgi:hypothetical protein
MLKSVSNKVLPQLLHLFPLPLMTSFAGFKSKPEYWTVPQPEQTISIGIPDWVLPSKIIKLNESEIAPAK